MNRDRTRGSDDLCSEGTRKLEWNHNVPVAGTHVNQRVCLYVKGLELRMRCDRIQRMLLSCPYHFRDVSQIDSVDISGPHVSSFIVVLLLLLLLLTSTPSNLHQGGSRLIRGHELTHCVYII